MFCSQELWFILSGLDIQLKQYENDNPASKKLVHGYQIQFFFDQHKSMAQWLR